MVNDGNSDSEPDKVVISVSLSEEEEPDTEPQRKPRAFAGIGARGGEGQIVVSWAAPSDQDNPPLTGYSVQYRKKGEGSWISAGHSGSGTSTMITGLAAGEYQYPPGHWDG